jgi:hypothetical protein
MDRSVGFRKRMAVIIAFVGTLGLALGGWTAHRAVETDNPISFFMGCILAVTTILIFIAAWRAWKGPPY